MDHIVWRPEAAPPSRPERSRGAARAAAARNLRVLCGRLHPRGRWSWACVAAVAALMVAMAGGSGRSAASWPPERLRDTGLYADWEARIVRDDNLPFAPQYPLWSDGAAKSRWIHLPKGTWIDASALDAWKFPVGTRLWKEFRFDRRAETRFIERTAEGWQYATYVWTSDETDAILAPERGISRSVEIRDGVRHAIPSRSDCRACHEAGAVPVLGISALQLSTDRDPNALHAEPLPEGAVDLRILVERELVRGLPHGFLTAPPRIQAETSTARAALGYLHANCGTCHNASGSLASMALFLDYPLERPAGHAPPAVATALDRMSQFRPNGAEGLRVSAGDPQRSVLLARMSSRHPVLQMPPLGTRLVDEEAVRLIGQWIADDLARLTRTVQSREDR